MISRYVVELYKPHQYRRDYTRVGRRAFRTLASARRAADRMLARHPRVVTRAGGGDRQSWGAEIVDAKTSRTIDVIDAPIHIVPSVGELGYW